MTGAGLAGAVSADAMRAEADQINAAVREDNRALWERSRRARQLAWEASLIDQAADARAEHEGAARALPRLEDAVTAALTAERLAEDRLRGDEKRLALRRGELEKARADHAPGGRREELAVRIQELAAVAADSRADLEKAAAGHAAAREARDTWQAHVSALYGEHAEAARRAQNPGTAPGMPPIAPGVGRISDLDEETRQLIGAVALLVGASRSEHAPAGPGQGARLSDTSRFRTLSLPGGRGVILPPALS